MESPGDEDADGLENLETVSIATLDFRVTELNRGVSSLSVGDAGFLRDGGIRCCTGWDDDDEDKEEKEAEARRPKTGTFSCTRGSGGVTFISLSPHGETLRLGDTLANTLSAAAAVHGTHFKWVRGETLGRGSLGRVFKALDQATGRVVAVKEVLINQAVEDDLKFKRALENEISICKDLVHPRIVSYLGHDSIDSCLYIYLEYMPGGSLAKVLADFGPLDESLICVYARELLEGLEYLHTRDPPVMHRDIKGANVLVGLDCRVKLADFGCSRRTTDDWSLTMKGSIAWMAPEVIRQTGCGLASDIWSFGCVVIEMTQAAPPWGHMDNPMAAMIRIAMSEETPLEALDKDTQNSTEGSLSAPCRDLVRLCTQRNAESRPGAASLLRHACLGGSLEVEVNDVDAENP